MSFRRTALRCERPDAAALTRRMAGIGMNFATEGDARADIEATLVHASEVGMDDHDHRVLGVLTRWLDVHRAYVHADRVIRMLTDHPSGRVRAYWAAFAVRHASDRRFAKLAVRPDAGRVELLPVGNAFQVQRRGEDERFVHTALQVPAGTLRDREADVLSPEALAARNGAYRLRVHMGPSWRTVVWTLLEDVPGLSVAEVARRAGCGFATAWPVVRDHRTLRRSDGLSG